MSLLEHKHGVMWLGKSRALYSGALGEPGERLTGCYILYAALDDEFEFSCGERHQSDCRLALAPPYQKHSITMRRADAALCAYMIEPDSLAPEALESVTLPCLTPDRRSALLARMREASELLGGSRPAQAVNEAALDRRIFGRELPSRTVDPRIGRVLERMRSEPTAQLSGEACAALIHLSLSRFLHLFRQEVGIPFRQFRAWRRARHFLGQVASDDTLTSVAIDLGYPDATHFSHSIRRVYGLKPKDVCAAMRDSEIIVPQAGQLLGG